MKKNKMMRIASVLLVAVLLSTCAISGTFAKYVTSSSSSDTARVAYWGFNNTTFEINDLFTHNDAAVLSNEMIAPGTRGSTTFSFKPQNETAPEVAYKITVSTTGSEIDDALVANGNIQWKLDEDGEWGSFADMCAAIEALSTDTIAPNQWDDSWGATAEHTVNWQWLINDNSDATNSQNVTDTALGNKTTLDEVTLVITIVAEQVDDYDAPTQGN